MLSYYAALHGDIPEKCEVFTCSRQHIKTLSLSTFSSVLSSLLQRRVLASYKWNDVKAWYGQRKRYFIASDDHALHTRVTSSPFHKGLLSGHITMKSPVPTALLSLVLDRRLFSSPTSLRALARRLLPSFRRCFPSGTQLPYDSNPVASGYVKRCTFLATCSRLVGIGFESQPTPSPVSSQSSLHAMNNKWHTKKWKSNVSTKQILPML
jgi:hypothetical protein